APVLIRLFTPDEAVIRHGVTFINICTPFYVFLCLNQIQAGALRGTGNAKAPMLVMLFSFVAFRQIYLFVISRLIPGHMGAVAMGYPMGWIMASLLLFLCYRRSPLWRRNTTEEQPGA
ncbi:MAG: MATE family efflux transporter, partial [Clostridia bacterium]|nr:MATE family efflux transporter [Clostridia bacterium]